MKRKEWYKWNAQSALVFPLAVIAALLLFESCESSEKGADGHVTEELSSNNSTATGSVEESDSTTLESNGTVEMEVDSTDVDNLEETSVEANRESAIDTDSHDNEETDNLD